MESHEKDSITAFDTLYTTNHLQMLKILLPHIQADMQPYLAIYIKFSELLFTIQSSRHPCISCFGIKEKEADIQELIHELNPYLSGNEKEMLQKIADMKDTMENVKQMSQMMQMMENFSDSPESVLQNYLSEEQINMFKMFQEDVS